MNRKLFVAVVAALAVIGTAPVFAQSDAGNPPPPPHAWGGRGPGPGGFEFGGMARGFGGKTVAGAPFSRDSHEHAFGETCRRQLDHEYNEWHACPRQSGTHAPRNEFAGDWATLV